jgi:hypothetical protein
MYDPAIADVLKRRNRVWSRISKAAKIIVAVVLIAMAVDQLVVEGPGERGINYVLLVLGSTILAMEALQTVVFALVKRRARRKVESSGG